MAELTNRAGTLRFRLVLADREAGGARWLAHAGVEHLDGKDGEWLPFARLPTWRLGPAEAEGLAASLGRLVRGEVPGFAFRSEVSGQLALQLGRTGERVDVEVGLDLGPWISAWSGTPEAQGEDLALFRFSAEPAGLVAFAAAFRTEVEELRSRA